MPFKFKFFNLILLTFGFSSLSLAQETPFEGNVKIKNGNNLLFQAPVNSPNDAGDIVFQKYNGEETARIYSNYDHLDPGSIYFAFGPNVVPKMIFKSNGFVGIGTTYPQTKLDVDISNAGEAKSVGIFTNTGISNPVNAPSGGLRFSWYGNNLAEIQMVRGNDKNDGLGLSFHTSQTNSNTTIEAMRITSQGQVAIGTTDPKGYKLAVGGSMVAESVTVKLQSQWPDYVFEEDYQLPTLLDLEAYVKKNKRLPNNPSEQEVAKNGVNVGEMIKLQTLKIEELTLYLIEKDKLLRKQEERLKRLERLLSVKN